MLSRAKRRNNWIKKNNIPEGVREVVVRVPGAYKILPKNFLIQLESIGLQYEIKDEDKLIEWLKLTNELLFGKE